MKIKLILIASLTIFVSTVFAQKLTRQETINYINEKLNEAEALRWKNEGVYGKTTLTTNDFQTDSNRLNHVVYFNNMIIQDRESYSSFKVQSFFNPSKISRIVIDSTKTTTDVGSFYIYFNDKNPLIISNNSSTNSSNKQRSDYITVYYKQSDKLMYERLSKAFLHLKDLAKAAEKPDPFAN
ncbi:hypothetical protein [Pedobacter frigiditerrae]|uniref:hypothetical protein n=1 Tax=Pedobacter frigiditerrae TaxID=2530452 RepID=UPI00292EE7EE|nr:hypothetical protein [Pedobacter frigiditerrae]